MSKLLNQLLKSRFKFLVLLSIPLLTLTLGCTSGAEQSLTIYSGRSESLVGPLIERFSEETGIEVNVRYESSSILSNLIVEEGQNSPADIFYSQSPVNILAVENLLTPLSDSLTGLITENAVSENRLWAIVSGRVRSVVYNPELISETDIPSTIFDFTNPSWSGDIAWAPENGSFQTMVAIMLNEWGEEKTRSFIDGIVENDPVVYPNNGSLVQGVANGEAKVGFTNHYYALRLRDEFGASFSADNAYLDEDDLGSVNLFTAVGILDSSKNKNAAERFIEFLVSIESQRYFSQTTFETPILDEVETREGVPKVVFTSFDQSKQIDLSLAQNLLRDAGALP